jgi:hypothetical protein
MLYHFKKNMSIDKMKTMLAKDLVLYKMREAEQQKKEKTLLTEYELYIWFYPKLGKYLYSDKILDFEIVELLLKEDLIKFNGIKEHQSIKMIRYSLK